MTNLKAQIIYFILFIILSSFEMHFLWILCKKRYKNVKYVLQPPIKCFSITIENIIENVY